MKMLNMIACLFFCMLFLEFNIIAQTKKGNTTIDIQIDASQKFQQIDGFGVNANTRSWDHRKLVPALNMLIDSMNSTVWRVIVETVYNWEDKDDNSDPFTFNWDYYNKLYETPKFQKAWDMIQFLNSHGITKNLMINFMGPIPLWMGGKSVKAKYEDEYIEMLVSFFYYAVKVKHLQIGLVSIMNEPDIENEGPTVSPQQYAQLLRKFIDRMDSLGLSNIRIVAPDVASMNTGSKAYIPFLMKDSVIMSKIAHFGLHSYGGYYAPVDSSLKMSEYPQSTFWITEWNNWCNGCDEGILGEYDYNYAQKSISYLLDLLKHGASAGIVWEGYDSYYEHHAPSSFSYWGVLAYDPQTKTYHPRKTFYAIQQVSRFVLPGAWQVSLEESTLSADSIPMLAFYDSLSQHVTIIGINTRNSTVMLNGAIQNLPNIDHFYLYYTDSSRNLQESGHTTVSGKGFKTSIPPNCIFTLTNKPIKERPSVTQNTNPEPPDWYTGDIHVHRNCGVSTIILPYDTLASMMEANDLSVASLLADMGNGEVKYSKKDLPKVNGKDAPQSTPRHIIHWDAEWHWDATYSQFGHQALGGHLVLLGLNNAHQIWSESTHDVLEWADKQNAVTGFAHMEYLNGDIQENLNCCIPIEFPVEAALGTIDFVSEDVYAAVNGVRTPNNGNYFSEGVVNAYYKLLNCGFRLSLAAGTDYPCNYYEPWGSLLTYVEVPGKQLTYRKWIDGIAKGRTVVSRNGHNEFLDLKVNNKGPGSDISFKSNDSVTIKATWSAKKETKGWIEFVCNGKIIARKEGIAKPGAPLVLTTTEKVSESSWICARRMDPSGQHHILHTSPAYVTIDKKPIRASTYDAQYFVTWINNILQRIQPGGPWHKYYKNDLKKAEQNFRKARDIYKKIALQSSGKEDE